MEWVRSLRLRWKTIGIIHDLLNYNVFHFMFSITSLVWSLVDRIPDEIYTRCYCTLICRICIINFVGLHDVFSHTCQDCFPSIDRTI